nr:basic endochitinase c [Quercus suber]
MRIGIKFLGSAPRFTSSSSSFGRIYAFLSISVSSPSGKGAPRDLEDGIFFNWSRLIIEYVFHKVYFMLDEGIKDWLQSLWDSHLAPLSCTSVRDLPDFAGSKDVLSLIGIEDLLSFVGIEDLPRSPQLCWDQGSPKFYFPRVKDLLDFVGIKDVPSLARINDFLNFVGIKDLLGFASWSQGKAVRENLINNPDSVATDAMISFKTAIWLWMTPQGNKPSSQNVIIGKWTPTPANRSVGRVPSYGVITNIINGGLERGRGHDERVASRISFYKKYCDIMGLSYENNLDCYNQRPFD